MVFESLADRCRLLDSEIQNAESSLTEAPDGSLRISTGRNGADMYYIKKDAEKGIGTYIRQGSDELVHRLAQKKYDERFLKKAVKERNVLKGLIKFCNKEMNSLSAVYEDLPEKWKKLISPYEISDERYAKQWQSMNYEGLEFMKDETAVLVTDRNEKVRSKSEMIIANRLNAFGVCYKYECPLILSESKIMYPDFTILNAHLRKEFYLEHFGMMDNSSYCERAVEKIVTYSMYGYFPGDRLLISMETTHQPINVRFIDKMIRKYFC